MTDNEIIKALECCLGIKGRCIDCPIYESEHCTGDLHDNALNLIINQKEEIERLNKDCEDVIYKLEYLLCNATGNKFSKHTYPIGDMVSYVNDYIQDCCNEAVEEAKEAVKSEAIKEFAERLKENLTGIGRSTTYGNFEYGTVKSYEIDNLVKEMTGRLK